MNYIDLSVFTNLEWHLLLLKDVCVKKKLSDQTKAIVHSQTVQKIIFNKKLVFRPGHATPKIPLRIRVEVNG